MLTQNQLSVYFARQGHFTGDILLDWEKYELILFNIIQNAIKYNSFQGNIVFVLKCYRYEGEEGLTSGDWVFETQIIDTGVGITNEIKRTMFVPFKELRVKENYEKVNNYTCGLGLFYSQQIA